MFSNKFPNCHITQSIVTKVNKKIRYFGHVRDNLTKLREHNFDGTKQ